jgi:hypothetical protein
VQLHFRFYQKPFEAGVHSELFTLWKKDFPGTEGFVVRIVTMLRTGRSRIMAKFPTGLRVTYSQMSSSAVGLTRFYSVGPWVLSVWVKTALVCDRLYSSSVLWRLSGTPVSTTMTYSIQRVKVETGARQKPTSERSLKNTLSFKSHSHFYTTNFLTKNLNCQVLRDLIWCDLLFYGSSSTFFRFVCIIFLASDSQRSIQWPDTKPLHATYDTCHISYHSTGRLHTHWCGYVTRSHVGVSCGIISCTCCGLQDIIDQCIFLVILVAVTNEHKKHCQYEYT